MIPPVSRIDSTSPSNSTALIEESLEAFLENPENTLLLNAIAQYPEEILQEVLEKLLSKYDLTILIQCEQCRKTLKKDLIYAHFLSIFTNSKTYLLFFTKNTSPLSTTIPEDVTIPLFVRDWRTENPLELEARLSSSFDVSGINPQPKNITTLAYERTLESAKEFHSDNSFCDLDWDTIPKPCKETPSLFYETRVEDIDVGIAVISQPSKGFIEDFHKITSITVNGQKAPLFAVFDGHGSHPLSTCASQFIGDILPQLLEEELRKLHEYSDLTLEKTFIYTCMRLGKNLQRNPRSFGGTTMTFCLVLNENIWCVNVGDSRACLLDIEKNIKLQLSKDAELTNPFFRKIVEDRGGEISPHGKNSILRVNGCLAMACAFESLASYPLDSIIPYPTITKNPLGNATLLILASDGVFDVMTSKQALEHIETRLKEGASLKKIAQEITLFGSFLDEDDTTTLICDLRKNLT